MTTASLRWRYEIEILVFFEEHRFQPSGSIHAACAKAYFETTDVLERIRHFNPGLGEADLEAIGTALQPGGNED